MAKYQPRVKLVGRFCQTKVQQEIDDVLGDRPPTLDDRGQLSYTEATIMEIQRLGSIAPQAVPHRAYSDINVRGYRIPRDTIIFSMLYHIMRDPDYWQDPESFKPERFLDEDGKVIKEERFVPFGIGNINYFNMKPLLIHYVRRKTYLHRRVLGKNRIIHNLHQVDATFHI